MRLHYFGFLNLVLSAFAIAVAAEPSTIDPHQSRSTVIATHGMVATSHPLASSVGLDVLKQGGNAVDAAIAANAMLGLVEPMSCGIGGDLFAIYWDAKTGKLYGLNASGRSPYALDRQVFNKKGLSEIPLDGPLSWSVPGCVDGWFELHERFGKQEMARLLRPSIEYGRAGFPVTEIIAGYWSKADQAFAGHADSQATFLIDGKPPVEGQIFRNPNLANTYALIAEGGREAFYRGSIARRIDRRTRTRGHYCGHKKRCVQRECSGRMQGFRSILLCPLKD